VTEQSSTQVVDFFSVAKAATIPNNIQMIAGDSVAKSCSTYLRFNAAAKDNLRTCHNAMTAALASAKVLGDRILLNAEANAQVTFDAAEAISRAKTWADIARLQLSFTEKQVSQMSKQAQEFCELSMKVSPEIHDAMSSTTAKTLEQARKVGSK
jgi:hypothetical protein